MTTVSLDVRPRQPLRVAWGVAIGYVLVFLLLDWVSYIRPLQGLNVTPWNPQPALAIALLLWSRRSLGLVWTGLLVAEVVVRGVPSNWFVTLAATASLSLSYAAIARAVEDRLDPSLKLATRRDLLWLTGIILTGALFSGTVYVLTYVVAGYGPSGPVIEAIARYWVGDAVGLIVLLPMLLMFMDSPRRAALGRTLRERQSWLIGTLIVVLLWAVFGREDHDHFRYFYVLLLPVVWASARRGLPGAVLAAGLTQVGLIVCVQWAGNPDLSVFELQVLMAALTMTGLTLGVAIDERERAQAELNRSLRLAAAGQMAAALAHELSRPLTALDTYAQAVPPARSSVRHAGERTALSAGRHIRAHGERCEAGQRCRQAVAGLLPHRKHATAGGVSGLAPNDVLDAQQRRAEALGIHVDRDIADTMRPVLIDPVQIAVVLRNLIANALDAATEAREPAHVSPSVHVNGRVSGGSR